MNLISLILRLPWFAYLAIAGGVVWLGMQTADTSAQRATEIQLAIDAGPPAAVALSELSHPGTKFAEATIRAQVVMDEAVRLVDRTNGIKTGEDVMLVLADPAAAPGLKRFKGIMILTTSEYDAFADWAMEHVVDFGEISPVIEFPAMISTTDGEASHAKDALKDRGGMVTGDVVYVTPYITKTREETLANALKSAENTPGNFNGIAGLIALFGIGKLLIGRRMNKIHAQNVQDAQARQAQMDAYDQQNQEGLRNF